MASLTVALIADIHANRYALQAVLDYLDAHPEFEQVWNVGDFLQIGPHPAEVADRILSDKRIFTVLGNNEQALLHRDATGFREGELAHQEWTIAQLGRERLERIRLLPEALRLTVCGKRVLLIHEQPSGEDACRDIDLVCCGHTHLPSYQACGSVGILNPGSLGFSWGHASAAICVLQFDDSSYTCWHLALPYDRKQLSSDYDTRQVPDREYIRSSFLPEYNS